MPGVDAQKCVRCGVERDPLELVPCTAEGETGDMCPEHPTCHRFVAKILVGPLEVACPNPAEEPTVRQGMQLVRIILVNGEMYAQWMQPFNLEELAVVANWNQTWKTDWRRVEAV